MLPTLLLQLLSLFVLLLSAADATAKTNGNHSAVVAVASAILLRLSVVAVLLGRLPSPLMCNCYRLSCSYGQFAQPSKEMVNVSSVAVFLVFQTAVDY